MILKSCAFHAKTTRQFQLSINLRKLLKLCHKMIKLVPIVLCQSAMTLTDGRSTALWPGLSGP